MKCEECKRELANGRNRIMSKAENGLCGDCVLFATHPQRAGRTSITEGLPALL